MKAVLCRLFYAFGVFNQRAAVARSTYRTLPGGLPRTLPSGEVRTLP